MCWEMSGCAICVQWFEGRLRWARWVPGLGPHSTQLKDLGVPVLVRAGATAWCKACLFERRNWFDFKLSVSDRADVAIILWLTHNQEVRRRTVHPSFIGTNAGDVSCVCKVHSSNGQNALYIQSILPAGANLLLDYWCLRTWDHNWAKDQTKASVKLWRCLALTDLVAYFHVTL